MSSTRPSSWALAKAAAASSYKEDAAAIKEQLSDAAKKVRDAFREGWKKT